MPKNIVICCDGTGNEFSQNNSNVVKLYSILDQNSDQISYYHPGLGTMGSKNALSAIGKWWTRLIGLAFGYGISENIADAYQFLMRNYEEGDKIYVFGFSRGAYTARALCGLLHLCGLLTRGNESLIPYAIRMVKKKNPDKDHFDLMFKFQNTFSRRCKPHFVGVWDTVSSVGWIYNPIHFLCVTKNKDLNIVRHAMSIDERRAFFRQNLFYQSPDAPAQDIIQLWFAGVHCDVGGGYPEISSGLSKIALKWMIDEAGKAGLLISEEKVNYMLGGGFNIARPDPKADIHNSLYGWWWLAEIWPKRPYRRGAANEEAKKYFRIYLASPRHIDEETAVLDESVRERMNEMPEYRPKNLRSFWPGNMSTDVDSSKGSRIPIEKRE